MLQSVRRSLLGMVVFLATGVGALAQGDAQGLIGRYTCPQDGNGDIVEVSVVNYEGNLHFVWTNRTRFEEDRLALRCQQTPVQGDTPSAYGATCGADTLHWTNPDSPGDTLTLTRTDPSKLLVEWVEGAHVRRLQCGLNGPVSP